MGYISAMVITLVAVGSLGVIVNVPASLRPDWLFVLPVIILVIAMTSLNR
jgi:hypothetical protein